MSYTLVRNFRLAIIGFLVLFVGACATTRPPDVTSPRSTESAYPILVNEDLGRRQAALAAWQNLLQNQHLPATADPELLPITSTLQSLPNSPATGLTLPRVGRSDTKTEEEMRESLRRFLASAGQLLCSDQDQLTLVKRDDYADGTKAALYEQRPFRYALRGGFGQVKIQFTDQGSVRQLSSTCLPDLDNIQRDIQGLRADPTVTPDKIAAILQGHPINSPDGSTSATVTSTNDFTLLEPVVLVRKTQTTPQALEFRLVWEVALKAGFPVYVDTVDSSILILPAA
jgi:hypothetical protein